MHGLFQTSERFWARSIRTQQNVAIVLATGHACNNTLLGAIINQVMHLQQAKVGTSGGPQYWPQKAPEHILEHIQRHKQCQVILQTPYGPVETPFNAVDPDHKIVEGTIVKANAQHYRIQKGESKESIGEAIRHWFALDEHRDFERIEIKITFDKKSRFILAPTEVHWRKISSPKILASTEQPLSFNG